jgi:hypothetical protein
MLLALRLLRLLFVLAWAGGALDRRELCRFIGGTKGSAPGTVSSVRPALEFGALARKEGVSGSIVAEWEITGCTVEGGGAHIHPGVSASPTVFTSCMTGGWVEYGTCCLCSETVPRQEAISSSLIGDAPL